LGVEIVNTSGSLLELGLEPQKTWLRNFGIDFPLNPHDDLQQRLQYRLPVS